MSLLKAHTKQYNKKCKKEKNRPKFGKRAEKSAKWYKIHVNNQKPTNHYESNPEKDNITN